MRKLRSTAESPADDRIHLTLLRQRCISRAMHQRKKLSFSLDDTAPSYGSAQASIPFIAWARPECRRKDALLSGTHDA
jgi:hypothetical protein